MAKFGLKEAQVLAGEPDAHLPTVKATLRVLGVKNVVGQQVAKLATGAKAAIASANKAIADLRVGDAEDEQVTVKQIGDLRTARDTRAKANTASIAIHDKAVSGHRQVMEDLQALAKKFA